MIAADSSTPRHQRDGRRQLDRGLYRPYNPTMIDTSMFIEIVGWLGAAIVVGAFALVSYGSVGGRSRVYQALNAVGGLLLAVNTVWHRAWPASAVNIMWMGIAVGAWIMGPKPRRAAPHGR